jgi:nucleotide-binding universal stress UspA family protein
MMELPKIEVKTILYATDLSENARLAYAYALNLAELYGAKLVILHAVPEDPDLEKSVVGWISADQWQEIKERNLQEARHALIGKQKQGTAIREVLDRASQNAAAALEGRRPVVTEICIEKGHAVDEILRVCQEKDCDLIVMGSHGYGTLKDAMMGGTARRILRRAKVPVLLVRIPAD